MAAALRPPALFANTANVPLSKNKHINPAIIKIGDLSKIRIPMANICPKKPKINP